MVLFFLALLFCFDRGGFAQDGDSANSPENREESPVNTNINFDGRMLAGLNGDSLFSLSMTQGLKDFAYQLNSSVVYTNDFSGYSNSSFFTNETGFTGELGFGESWKVIPEFEIANSTYGMFNNAWYSRENKDRINLRMKTEYKPGPARWNFDLIGARYDHGLKVINMAREEQETIYKGKSIIGMDYIWSDANKLGFILEGAGYNYPKGIENDAYASGELFFSFKITEYIMPTITFPVIIWNRDGTGYIYAKGNISTINLRYVSVELLHEYTLSPYRPEELINSQKYVQFGLNLPPSTVNHSELKSEFDFDFSSDTDSNFSVSAVGLKLSGVFENCSNFYNYVPLRKNVLSAEAIPVKYINGNTEFVTSFIIFGQKLNIEFAYDYFKYYTSKNNMRITYRPENIYKFNISLDGSRVEIDWSNSYKGSVYTDPDSDNKLDGVLFGTLDIHLRVYDTFYIDSRIDNLYNRKYSYREGYPEPGVQYYIGLRVMF